VANGEGRYVAEEEALDSREEEDRVVHRYVDEEGRAEESANPNGSMRSVAGVCSAGRNVVGVMPHPERASLPYLGSTDGLRVLESVLTRTAGAA
jgi:phosphoribosylformylglycinamidine synthase